METVEKKRRAMSDTPRELDLLEYVGERVTEIADLLQVVDNHDLPTGEVTQGPRTVLQRLPRHMRRRAMSYNVKRLPRSQRPFGISAIAKSNHRPKPPSRFHRRRARNLLKAYIRRQRRNIWLETHIWHAKRFLMRDIWGYRLAESSYQRGFRPAYRDSVRHCLVRDISYMRCLELRGDERVLIDGLGHLCASQLGPTVAFRAAHDGRIEFPLILYRKDRYPFDAIGPVRLLWMPRAQVDIAQRTLWIWVHPSCANELSSELIDLFRLSKNESKTQKKAKRSGGADDDEVAGGSLDAYKVERMEVATEEYSSDEGITLTDLRDQLVRVRLSGRRTMNVLAQTLRLVDVEEDVAAAAAVPITTSWISPSMRATYADHHRQWQLISRRSPAELGDGLVTSLLIEDPRLSRPAKKGLHKEMDGSGLVTSGNGGIVPDGAIWLSSIRQQVLRSKVSESELQKRRGESTAPLSATDAKLPLLVIVRNASAVTDSNVGAGVDLIAPSGFGMPLWLAVQYGTARAGGLREERTCAFEAGQFAFPDDFPDCAAGLAAANMEAKECEEKYLRRPHNRRIPYWSKLRIKYPFSFCWKELIDGWTEEGESFYVLRDRAALKRISLWMQGKGGKEGKDGGVTDLMRTHRRALIAVSLDCPRGGSPGRRALICLPADDDRLMQRTGEKCSIVQFGDASTTPRTREVLANKDASSTKPSADAPLEDFVSFDNEVEVNMNALFPDKEGEKIAHRKAKERQRKRQSKKRSEAVEDVPLPDTNVVRSCARPIVGFVVRGGFSFAVGRGRALGYCSLAALERIGQGHVLFRNTTSKIYRFAKLSVMKLTVNI